MPLVAAVPALVSAGAATVGAAAIKAGSSYLSAKQQSKAAGKAVKAQQAAAEQQLALQREQQQRAERLYNPTVQGGNAAFDALMSRFGLQQPQVRPTSYTTPAGAQVGGNRTSVIGAQGFGGFGGDNVVGSAPPPQPDLQGYLDANPDVAENARQRAAAEGIDPLTVAQQHWDNFGQTEGRTMPQVGQTPQAAPTAPEAIQADPNAPPDYMNMARPDAPEAPTFQRPEAMQAPAAFSYTPQDIENDKGYQFARDESLKGVNSNFAARGRLRSGGALKALQDRAAGVAHQFDQNFFNRALSTYNANTDAYRYGQNRQDNLFGDDRAYDTARWQDQRTYGDARFDAERNYQTNRYDTQTDNLFNIANMGQNAINGTVTAGSQYANNAGNVFQNTANVQASAAQQRGEANAGAIGAIGGAVGNIFANWGGGVRAPTAPAAPFSASGYRSWVGGNW